MADTEHHPYLIKVSELYGTLIALGQAHPKTRLIQALDVPGGLSDWVRHHRPDDDPDDEPHDLV